MEIGVIIFIIWLIVSVVGGIIEGSSKKKKGSKSNKPQHTTNKQNGNPKPSANNVDNKQLELQELMRKYHAYKDKAEQSTTEQMSNHYGKLATEFEQKLKEHNIDVEKPKPTREVKKRKERVSSNEHVNKYITDQKEKIHQNRPRRQQETINSLLEYSNEEMKSLSKLQNENIAQIEKEADEIIHNVQLSERTRRVMVKQLYLNSKHKFNDEAINVDENEVVNGIIWSEILKRPTELK